MSAEARVVRELGAIGIGGGSPAGALSAAEELVANGARALLSFGFAGGLDPRLRPGTLVIPRAVLAHGERLAANPGMVDALGGATADLILGTGNALADPVAKRAIWEQTGAAAVDLESGAVAQVGRRHRLPFAVLRAVCDPAERSLPPAALLALDRRGSIQLLKVLASVATNPAQILVLLRLARDAALARRALIRRVAELGNRLAGV